MRILDLNYHATALVGKGILQEAGWDMGGQSQEGRLGRRWPPGPGWRTDEGWVDAAAGVAGSVYSMFIACVCVLPLFQVIVSSCADSGLYGCGRSTADKVGEQNNPA